MARFLALNGEGPAPLAGPWQMALGEAATPDQTAGFDWIPATVPGTAAQALVSNGMSDPDLLSSLHCRTLWFRCPVPAGGERWLTCEGLGGACTLWLGRDRLGDVDNAVLAHRLAIKNTDETVLYFQFHPLGSTPGLAMRRQRWRPHLVAAPALRQHRQSFLGHMPGWCPALVPVGPVRPVTLVDAVGPDLSGLCVRATCDGATGTLEIALNINGLEGPFTVRCGEVTAPLAPADGLRYAATLRLPDVRRWWPHTHGAPTLYPLEITSQTATVSLGKVGFRSLALDRGPDGRGFGLIVNGEPVFCRGANWTSPDVLTLAGGRDVYRPWLERARAAGMNMIRIPGLMAPETPDLTELCDELGILVWQDMMFANFDYDFSESSAGRSFMAELDQFCEARQGSPALAVISGGSELAQQPAMLSLPETVWRQPFLTETFPARLTALRPDLVALPTSPFGGVLPFAVGEGVSHYFGVGAYRRPLEDARRAEVRFAAECLAFANLPMPDAMPVSDPEGADWAALVVRDLKADWDFEDVRDHYTALLYGVDPTAMKAAEPARYLRLAAATSGEVMEAAFAEWRRAGSCTTGALVWTLNDVAPGFGWGVLDHRGQPKPVWYALRRAFRPLQLILTDEGLDGLAVHLLNETAEVRAVRVTLTAYGSDGLPVIAGERTVALPPRSVEALSSAVLFGVFFDVTHAYRFGPPAHGVTVARMTDAVTGEEIADSVHFPHGRGAVMADPGMTAVAGRDEAGPYVDLSCARLAQSVMLAAPGFEPEDNGFHCPPGVRRIRLAGTGIPSGTAFALNADAPVAF